MYTQKTSSQILHVHKISLWHQYIHRKTVISRVWSHSLVDLDVGARAEMLLRSAAQSAGTVTALAPRVGRHVRPLQHTVGATQTGRKAERHIIPVGHVRGQHVDVLAVGQLDAVLSEAVLVLAEPADVAQIELEVAAMVGGDLDLDDDVAAGRIALDDDALAEAAAELVLARSVLLVVVAANAATAAVRLPLDLRSERRCRS